MQFLSALGLNVKPKLLVMAPDILLIGTGITSALTASMLQKSLPSANLLIWEKARGVGGRMSRSRNPKDGTCSADLGAQYITTSTDTMSRYENIYGPLIREGVLERLTAGVLGMKKFGEDARHFVAPQGMNSIVKFFLRDVPAENVHFESRVVAIREENGKLVVATEKNSSAVDVVVSTMPTPQFLQLSRSMRTQDPEHERNLERVVYSSRFVLVMYFDHTVQFPATDWACQYLDHDVFRYVSIDNVKRNRPEEPVAVIFHTSVKFGLDNVEKAPSELEEALATAAAELFPDWPKPTGTRCHKWRYSQVVEPFRGKPGCLLLSKKPMLVLGGDAFADSNFDGCVYSASKIVDSILENL